MMKIYKLQGVPSNVSGIINRLRNHANFLSAQDEVYGYLVDSQVIKETIQETGYPSDIAIMFYRYNKFSKLVDCSLCSYSILERELVVDHAIEQDVLSLLTTYGVTIEEQLLNYPGGICMNQTEQVLEALETAIMKVPVGVAQDVNKRISDWFEMGGVETDKYIQIQIDYLNSVAASL